MVATGNLKEWRYASMAGQEFGSNGSQKQAGLFIRTMRHMIKFITSLLLAISMAVTPVISVLATTVTDNAVHAQDPNVMPCHEMASGDVVKNKTAQSSHTHRCKNCSRGGSCQDGFLCSSCGHSAHLTALTSLAFLARHNAGDSYRSDLLDSYPSLILSPAFRPPIR